MDFHRCQPLCSRFIAIDDQHDSRFLIANPPFSPVRAAPEAASLHKAAAWSSNPELEAMESEQFPLSLPPLPKRHCVESPSAAFKQFKPWRAHELVTASSSRERPAPRKEPVGRVSDPAHPPPYTVWGAHSRSATHKRVDLKRPNKPPAAASLDRS
ncbi:hypothetical protein G5714_020374 [Onychostoma macrolepis]|uniref:Uncharacterized protein n=1 Tax=Onychostoma macrolepis TaxID=369639 RepID=A0A7J6BU51_9TELE|nr:hypothetical protein G5714_020374 [Onychostoma macrolepis]